MDKMTLTNEMASHLIRHRAICEDCNYKGSWRTNVDDAYIDARVHRKKPDNETHYIRIITEQRISMRFI